MKPRLTADEHAELGAVLAGIRDELTHRATQLGNAYPIAGDEGLPHRKVGAAIKALDEARSALDEALFREHPLSADPAVYYPPAGSRARIGKS